ncbi:AT-rich interactive domain-containing protein 1-like [Dorcoceras hygrometricum]|uniref:AT-rich interactive domain-containing protein 1-like n=1 Tax=Dorcoceras hygrometricum TaxID=472368 RepID=A0A2Z7CDL0_9LAMI|nr:AT-rich interactive domain-containing protein 1-like [Dorcoceras hygrometricum]
MATPSTSTHNWSDPNQHLNSRMFGSHIYPPSTLRPRCHRGIRFDLLGEIRMRRFMKSGCLVEGEICCANVALDSFQEALSSYTTFGGCRWLEQKHEAAVSFVRLTCAGVGIRFLGLFVVVIVTQNQGVGIRFLGLFVVVIVTQNQGFPGYSAGRGADPARGAAGGG